MLAFAAISVAAAYQAQQMPASTVIFYRQGGVWSKALDFPLSLDGSAIGSLHNGNFVRVSTSAGQHEVAAGGSILTQGTKVSIHTEAGKIYFLRIDNIKGIHERVAMRLVAPELAAKEISKLKESPTRQLN